jgi:hypothetical protein
MGELSILAQNKRRVSNPFTSGCHFPNAVAIPALYPGKPGPSEDSAKKP